MKPLIKSFLFGLLSTVIAGLVIWYLIPLLIPTSYFEKFAAFYPFLVLIPALIIGGYIGGRFAISNKLLIGFFIGLTSFGLTQLAFIKFSDSQFDLYSLVIPLFFGFFGLLGALLSFKRLSTSLSVFMILAILFTIAFTNYRPTDPNNRNLFDRGFSRSDADYMKDFKQILEKRSIEYNIYTRDGKEFIGYRSADEGIIEEIENELHIRKYGYPSGYNKFCSGEKSRSSIINTLEDASVNYHLIGSNCIAWPKEADDYLTENNPLIKELKEAKIRYNKENSN